MMMNLVREQLAKMDNQVEIQMETLVDAYDSQERERENVFPQC